MNDDFFKKMLLLAAYFLFMAICIFIANTAFAEERIAQVTMSGIREVVTYTNALEAENKQMKQSLESERASIDKMLADIEAERKATTEYTKLLEEKNNNSQKEITKINKSATRKNYIIAILTAAVVTLAVTH